MQETQQPAGRDHEFAGFDWQSEVARICESKFLSEARSLKALLRHLAEKTAAGDLDDLKEYNLGLAVFHRKPEYDPRIDAVVRVQASQLRKRLEQYYREESTASTYHITLPKGAYVLHLEPAVKITTPDVPSPEPQAPLPAPDQASSRVGTWVAVIVALIVGLTVGTFLQQKQEDKFVDRSGFPELWGPFLEPDAPLVCVFGVPQFFQKGALLVRDINVNTVSDLPKHGREVEKILGPEAKPVSIYTGVGELKGLLQLAELLRLHGKTAPVRGGHEFNTEELASNNVVLISSARFRTWIDDQAFASDFILDSKPNLPTIVNLDPRPGENKTYEPRSLNNLRYSYALVSLWKKSDRRRLLSIRGPDTDATQGAASYMVTNQSQQELRRKIGTWDDKATGLQIVLQIDVGNEQFQAARYVTHHWIYR